MNVPDNPKSSEFLEVQKNRKMSNLTAHQYIKQEQWNPWDVSSIFEFNYFWCPECDFKVQSDEHTETKQEFVHHASSCYSHMSNIFHWFLHFFKRNLIVSQLKSDND